MASSKSTQFLIASKDVEKENEQLVIVSRNKTKHLIYIEAKVDRPDWSAPLERPDRADDETIIHMIQQSYEVALRTGNFTS